MKEIRVLPGIDPSRLSQYPQRRRPAPRLPLFLQKHWALVVGGRDAVDAFGLYPRMAFSELNEKGKVCNGGRGWRR